MNDSSRCAICDALFGDASDPVEYPENTHLLHRDYFSVIPALGPFSLGHVMIVRNRHEPSLAAACPEARKEYEKVVDVLRANPVYTKTSVLEAEHGATKLATGGACIRHTHVNWIPGAGAHDRMFDGKFELLGRFESMQDLPRLDAPYLLLRGDSKTVSIYAAKGAPSQCIRRCLWNIHQRTDWNWHTEPNDYLVHETLKAWERVA